jgi:hypothetical protein
MNAGQDKISHSRSSAAVDAIYAGLAEFDMHAATPEQMFEARELAVALIGGEIVSPSTLSWVHERTGAAVFVAHEDDRLTGVWAVVMLTEAGVRACHDDTFDALNPDVAHVAERWEEPAGMYAWGVAGSTKESAKRVVAAGANLYQNPLAHLPYFTRPTTAAGVRLVIERFGFQPVPASTSGLVWMPPRARSSAAA